MTKEKCKDCEQSIVKICRACKEDGMFFETCSRCETKKSIDEFNNEEGEIPFCYDCEGICRRCATDDYEEEELEHGLCTECCADIDEEAEEQE